MAAEHIILGKQEGHKKGKRKDDQYWRHKQANSKAQMLYGRTERKQSLGIPFGLSCRIQIATLKFCCSN